MGIGWLVLFIVLGVAATARLTTLFVYDDIAAPLRAWVERRWPRIVLLTPEGLPITRNGAPLTKPSKMMTLFSCPWCMSAWVFALIVGPGMIAAYETGWWQWFVYPATGAAASYFTGFGATYQFPTHTHDDDDEPAPATNSAA